MLALPAITLVCIDCRQPALAIAALGQTLDRLQVADVLFVSDHDPGVDGLPTLVTSALGTPADRLRFIAAGLRPRIRTSHVLLVQWDAFVVDASAWTDAFLEHDWVAPHVYAPRESDNEGIALLSTRLLDAMGTVSLAGVETLRALVARLTGEQRPLHDSAGTSELALRLAPPPLAERFAFADGAPARRTFAFQGLHNMWLFFRPTDLDAFLSMAPAAVLHSEALADLALNLRELGRTAEAEAIGRARRQARPEGLAPGAPVTTRTIASDPAGGTASNTATGTGAVAPGSRTAVARNDPCPCGSGRKYKHCHGTLGAESPATAGPTENSDIASATSPLAASDSKPAGVRVPRGRSGVRLSLARRALERNDFADAEQRYREVLELEPANAVAIEYLGVVAMRLGRIGEAESLLRRALALDPQAPEFHNNLGLLLHSRGDFHGALECYDAAVSSDPRYAPAHNNRGLSLQELRRLDEAIASYRRATEFAPAFADAHWNLGLALLAADQYEEGLAEHEWRLKSDKDRAWWAHRDLFPTWQGEPIAGKRILILAEQGLGDQIQFARYATLLAQHGATVVIEAARELGELLQTVAGVTQVVPRDGPYPRCDLQIPLMSLPLRCATRPGNVPITGRYVQSDPARVARWEAQLGPRTRPRVGLAWVGNRNHVRDRMRSMPLSTLVPLLSNSRIDWISLQKGAGSEELDHLPPACAVRDMGRHSETMADLAALIDTLDLVITVDTSVAHVAGALGRPMLLLIDFANDWRWHRAGADSRWYDSARIVRQSAPGDWDGVAREIGALLAARFP